MQRTLRHALWHRIAHGLLILENGMCQTIRIWMPVPQEESLSAGYADSSRWNAML